MPEFIKRVVVHAPVGVLFAFHERPDALELLTPAFPPVRVVEKSGGIAVGGRVVLLIGGLIRWVALHTAFEKDALFVDEQIEGPFARWVHRHEFERVDDEHSRLTDRVTFALRGGHLANRLAAPFVQLGLSNMFAHRHRVTRRFCEEPSRSPREP